MCTWMQIDYIDVILGSKVRTREWKTERGKSQQRLWPGWLHIGQLGPTHRASSEDEHMLQTPWMSQLHS
jgi:hypothetical protein